MRDVCVFCAIVAGEAPATVLWRGEHSIIFRPLGPVVDGHVLIVPTVHVVDAAQDKRTTAQTMYDAALWAATEPGDEFNLITSAGRAATQSIFHLHVHYVPRRPDDGLMVPWGTAFGENPQDPHLCRELRDLGRAWNDGPRSNYYVAEIGAVFGESMDDLGDRVQRAAL